jgi:hypothetical protein
MNIYTSIYKANIIKLDILVRLLLKIFIKLKKVFFI